MSGTRRSIRRRVDAAHGAVAGAVDVDAAEGGDPVAAVRAEDASLVLLCIPIGRLTIRSAGIFPTLTETYRLFLASISQLHIDFPPEITFIALSWLNSVLQMEG